MTIKDAIEKSKNGDTVKIYGVIDDKGIIREYDCIIVPIEHTFFDFVGFRTNNYKLILTASNGYSKVIELRLTENELSSSSIFVNYPQIWIYYLNKEDALEQAFSDYSSMINDAEYSRESLIKFADNEMLKRIKNSDEYILSNRKVLKGRNIEKNERYI